MEQQAVIATLRRHQAALEGKGVKHVALFGSVARGDSRPDSDIDILIDLGNDTKIGVFEYVGLKDYIASLFEGPVDVVSRQGLKSHVSADAIAHAVYAF